MVYIIFIAIHFGAQEQLFYYVRHNEPVTVEKKSGGQGYDEMTYISINEKQLKNTRLVQSW